MSGLFFRFCGMSMGMACMAHRLRHTRRHGGHNSRPAAGGVSVAVGARGERMGAWCEAFFSLLLLLKRRAAHNELE